MCGMSPPVDRSITVSAPYLRQPRSLCSSLRASPSIWLLPMFALILHEEAMPMHIGSSSGWFELAGMIIRPRATSLRISSGGRFSRRATCCISSVVTPCRAKCICVTLASPRRRSIHCARMLVLRRGGDSKSRVAERQQAPSLSGRRSGRRHGSALELGDDPLGAVDMVERLDQGRAVHRDRTVHGLVEAVLAAERLDVTVEDQPDELAVLVEHRRPGVPANDVVGGA